MDNHGFYRHIKLGECRKLKIGQEILKILRKSRNFFIFSGKNIGHATFENTQNIDLKIINDGYHMKPCYYDSM